MLKILKSYKQYLVIGFAAVVVIASLLLVYFNVTAADTEGTCGDNLEWSYDADTTTLTITGYGDMTGWSKTKAPWYSYRSEITTVVFDCTDEEAGIGLGKYAFSGCSEITGMDLSDVTSIGNYTFYNCSGIVSLDISNVTSIDEYAFYGCTSLTEITVPASITIVSEGMFQNCTGLEKVTFLGTVTEIDNIAFYNCTSLTTIVWAEDDTSTGVTIPASVETMGTQAFYNCTSLASVEFEGTSVSFTAATKKKYGQFYGCTALTSLTLPSEQDTIPAYFLEECTSLAQIEIPSTVTTISKYAFYGTGLTSVTIPAAVTSMGERVFSNCTVLETVTFEEGIEIETIPTYLFEGCSTLYEVVIPDSVTTIETYAFKDCTSLASLTFGAGTQSIAIYTLYGCSNTDLELHFTCEYTSSLDINDDAFSGITAVAYYPADSETWPTSEAVEQNLQYGATDLTWAAEGEEVTKSTWWDISEDETTLYIYLDGAMVNYTAGRAPWYSYRSTITEIVFGVNPNAEEGDNTTYTLTSIGSYAFYNFTALEEVTIPASVTSIGNYAFYGCIITEAVYTGSGGQGVTGASAISGLTTVTFEEGSVLESIGDHAFASCSFLSEITIPSSVTEVGDYAFAECGIESLDCVISYVLGSEDNSNAYISVNDTTRILYGTDNTDYRTEEVEAVYIDDVELTPGTDYTIESSSENSNFTSETVIFSASYLETLTEGTHTGIISCADYYCRVILCVFASGTADEEVESTVKASTTYDGLASIDISNVEVIGEGVFYKCVALSSVTFGESLTTISARAFYYCDSLTSAEIPSSVTSIGVYAFGESGLVSVNIPLDAVIGDYAFEGCTDLTDVSFEALDTEAEGSMKFGDHVFSGCTSLAEITLPAEMSVLSGYLFEDCSALTTVNFEGSVSVIGEGTFSGCTALETLTGLEDVTCIEDKGFYNCSALKELDLPETIGSADIGDFAFYGCSALADENGFIVINGVLCTYDYSILSGVEITDETAGLGQKDTTGAVDAVIGTLDVPETVIEIADYAFYQIYGSANISTVALEGLRFNVPADSVTLEEYALAGLYETTYIYYSCLYAEGWEEALETIGYTGGGAEISGSEYDTSWGVEGVTEHTLSDELVWTWAEDYASASASYTCLVCGEEIVYEAEVTAETSATCTEGITVYTATITDDSGNTFTDIQTVETEPGPHTYGDVVWAWAEDYSSASASITCTVCGNVVSDDAEITASEETDGRTCVTASVTLEETEYTNSVWYTSNAADLTLSATELEMSKMVTSTVYAVLNESFTSEDGETCTLVGWTGTLTAESSDESVVTVEADGLGIIITGVSEGTATITVYAGEDVVGTIEVTSITVDCEGNHTWDEGVVTQEATCTEKGMITYTCTVCGENDYEVINALGHNYELTATSEATCTEDGYEVWVCTVCGYVDIEPTQSAFGHTYVLTDSKEATCDEEGYETYTCSTCGDSYTNVIEKTSHSFERTYQEPTCTEEGLYVYTCTICGYSYTVSSAALGHTWDDGVEAEDGSITYTCTVCGETYTEEAETEEETTEEETTEEETEETTEYEVTSEAAEYVTSSGDVSTAVITISAPVSDFVTIYLGDEELAIDTAYTVDGDEEETVITFTEEYLEYLEEGEYELTIVYADGEEVTAALTILEAEEEDEDDDDTSTSSDVSPSTSDDSNMLLWIVIFAAAIAALLAAATVYTKRKKINR